MYKQKYFIFSLFFLLSTFGLMAQEAQPPVEMQPPTGPADQFSLEDLQVSPEYLLAMLNEEMQGSPVFDDLKKDLGLLSDEQDREFILEAMQNPELLKDSEGQKKYDLIVERLNTVKLLNSIKDKVKDAQSHAKVSYWLSEQNLLDDEDVKEEAEKIITQVEKEGIVFAQKINARSDLAQDALVVSYSIYRKFRLLRALESGSAISDAQKNIDSIAGLLYLGLGALKAFGRGFYQYKFMEKYKREGDDQKAQACMQNMAASVEPVMNSLQYSVDMSEDDYSRLYNKKVETKKELDKADLREQKADLVGTDEEQMTSEYLLAVSEREEERARARFRAKSFDFFDTFDFYLNYRLENKLNGILARLKVPQIVRRVLLTNKGSRFLRQIMLFKMLPTGAHWLLSGKMGTESFWSSESMRQALKSSGKVAGKRGVDFLVSVLNGKGDEYGLGRLDKAKKYSLGIVGPNLIRLGEELTRSEAMLKMFDFEVDEQEASDGRTRRRFLEKEDFYEKSDGSSKQRIARKSSEYLAGSATTFVALKLISKCRGKLFGWFGKGMGKVTNLLVRRGWIEAETVEAFKMITMFSNQFGSALVLYNLLRLTHELLPLPGLLSRPLDKLSPLWRDNLMTRFDESELQAEMMRTGDQFLLLDYLLAAWIGKKVGKKFGGWVMKETGLDVPTPQPA
ncbi:hypothetical protein KAT92_01355 [Candidatus Babeliales bacterium]|nr:hypothetical protein [Candidatus Babeliales bacterium]